MQASSVAMDAQALDALRRSAARSPQAGLQQASRQFEALFLQMMLKSMREATPESGLLGSSAGKFYTGMLDQQLGQSLAGRGLGLAEMMQRQLGRYAGEPALPPLPLPLGEGRGEGSGLGVHVTSARRDAPTPALPQRGRDLATDLLPLPLGEGGGEGSGLGVQVTSARRDAPTPALPQRGRGLQSLPLGEGRGEGGGLVTKETPTPSLYERTTAAATWSRSALPPAHVERFMAHHMDAAQQASAASGVPAPLILAQAALESGWGRREPRGEDGRPSFNLFGIKADASWKGRFVEALTTEVQGGQTVQVRARFRAYASHAEAFADHARFLSSQPRYAAVLRAADAPAAAQGLQRAGYATDPQYAAKLQRLMQQM